MLVGVTGSMGAGKSALTGVFARLGYPVLSADEISREITATGSEGLAAIVEAFGPGVLMSDRSLNRGWLRALIASDPAQRQVLEGITHPLIQARSLALAKEHFARGASIVFYEAPLLFEARSDAKMDKVICVVTPEEVRLARVLARDRRSEAEVRRLMAAQMPQTEKAARADIVVENGGSEAELTARAAEVLRELGGLG